ncbi:hypothetical protein Pelo_8754 [Pelomyxa schiedti]|nr:hypothetical protein Pelo_8754 [Pelomyxa schiedti]
MGKWAALAAQNHGIHLISVSHGHNLRIDPAHPTEVNADGAEGIYATWMVEKVGKKTKEFRFRNKSSGKYLRIDPANHKPDCEGVGGPLCTFKLHWINKEHFICCLESVQFHGMHLGVFPDGRMKPANLTAEGPHGQWRIKLHV